VVCFKSGLGCDEQVRNLRPGGLISEIREAKYINESIWGILYKFHETYHLPVCGTLIRDCGEPPRDAATGRARPGRAYFPTP
jgi:hypothetical protein